MVESIEFSAGGFEAKYGDKMSSVLDIRYRKPNASKTRITASMLGAQLQRDWASAAGPNGHKKFTLNTGIRYRDNSYVLGTLDEGGEYQPRYVDVQGYATWDPTGTAHGNLKPSAFTVKTNTAFYRFAANPTWATSTRPCA